MSYSYKSMIAVVGLSAVVFAAPVSFEQASLVAENASGGSRLSLKHNSLKKRPFASAPPAEDALLYVFQNGGGGGFVIVAGDDAFGPVIGISDRGAYDPAGLPPNFAWYIDNIEREMEYALENGRTQTPEIRDKWAFYAAGGKYVMGEYLTKTRWNQGAPYNNQTPVIDGQPTVTGCVATAMAQMIGYHKYPAITINAIPAYTSNMAGKTVSIPALPPVVFDWENMADTYTSASEAAQIDAVAALMSAAGRSVKMNYGTNSAPGENDVPRSLVNYFGYDNGIQHISRNKDSEPDWNDILKSQIDDGLPVFYGGRDGNVGVGHNFILDGYDADGMFHVNWGWGGQNDGFYALTVGSGLNPGNYNFSASQIAIINIKPAAYGQLIHYGVKGGKYVLERDFDGNGKLTFQLNLHEDFTLDLNGHTLTVEVSGNGESGIKIASGKTFTVMDSRSGGVLNVANKRTPAFGVIDSGGAAINTADGTLIIISGAVNAAGGNNGAGIGGGYEAAGGTVIIAGGTVNAVGGGGGAGIGGGYNGDGGNVTITGGAVTAAGGGRGAGIGGGYNGGGGDVTIIGGAVTATGGEYAAGMGGGNYGSGGRVTITGGTVTAAGSYGGAGIGGGDNGAGGDVTINGGTVIADGGGGAKSIGGGDGGAGGTLAMDGNALVFANAVSGTGAKTSGILVIGAATNWYGGAITLSPSRYTIPASRTLTIPPGKTLTVSSGAALTVPSGASIANNGQITPADNSTVIITGTRAGNLIDGANVSVPALSGENGAAITISPAALLAGTGQSVEYAISATDAVPVSGWRMKPVFENLDAGMTYYIFARSRASANFASGASKSVQYGGAASVKSSGGTIPAVKPDEEAVVIAPMVILAGEFTAGPNPVSKQSGNVNFYRQGKRVSNCELRVYDAAGNVINKVKIKDNTIGNQSRRIVGKWDLTDRKGRLVSDGTYLVKGVLKTSDGKSEKVSLILGVL